MAIADVVGAYLLTMMDDYVLVKVTGRAVQTLCDVSDKYKEYIAIEKGKQVIYLRFKKALYG